MEMKLEVEIEVPVYVTVRVEIDATESEIMELYDLNSGLSCRLCERPSVWGGN